MNGANMRRTVFVLENDEKAMPYIDYLKKYHNVIHARRIDDAVYYLDDEYNIRKDYKLTDYDYFLFDANVPAEENVRLGNGEFINFKFDGGLHGLSVLTHFFEKIDTTRQKIVIVTAYAKIVRECKEIKKMKEVNEFVIPVIDKSSENFTKELKELFN